MIEVPAGLERAIAALFLVAALFGCGARRLESRLTLYVAQSLALAGLIALSALGAGDLVAAGLAALMLALKALGVPRLLRGALARARVRRAAEPLFGSLPTLVVGGALTALAYQAVASLREELLAAGLAAGLASALLGLFTMLTRQGPASQLLGLLVLENGVMLAALALGRGALDELLLVAGLEGLIALLLWGSESARGARPENAVEAPAPEEARS